MKRPDVAIFCCEPDDIDAAITMIPEAVVEVISRGYEKKDLLLGIDFYLARGVKDVVVLGPPLRAGDPRPPRRKPQRAVASPDRPGMRLLPRRLNGRSPVPDAIHNAPWKSVAAGCSRACAAMPSALRIPVAA